MIRMEAIDLTPVQNKYPGMWVGFADDQITVLAVGKTPQEVVEKAKENGYEDPVLMHMPKQNITYVGYGI